MKKILFTFMALVATLSLSAEEPKTGLQNVELKNLKNEPAMLPWYGEKQIPIATSRTRILPARLRRIMPPRVRTSRASAC